MKLLKQAALLLFMLFTGEVLRLLFHLPFPASVLGMVLLLLALCLGWVKVEQIEEISAFLLDHLAFFFLPAGVGLLAYLGLLKDTGLQLLLLCAFSTALIMGFTGWLVQSMLHPRHPHHPKGKEYPHA